MSEVRTDQRAEQVAARCSHCHARGWVGGSSLLGAAGGDQRARPDGFTPRGTTTTSPPNGTTGPTRSATNYSAGRRGGSPTAQRAGLTSRNELDHRDRGYDSSNLRVPVAHLGFTAETAREGVPGDGLPCPHEHACTQASGERQRPMRNASSPLPHVANGSHLSVSPVRLVMIGPSRRVKAEPDFPQS